MKHLLTLAVLCLVFGCAQPPANPAFETNVEHAKTWFEKFSAEDLDAVSDMIVDNVEWESCFYGAPKMTSKAEAMTYMKGWNDAMENISYTPENFLPGVDPETNQPNGSVRTYGTWRATSSASGKSFAARFYHYFTFNEEGKIINAGDFGDATGIMMAVAPDPEVAAE